MMSYRKIAGVALPLGFLAALISAPISATPITYSYTSGALLPSGAGGIPAVTNLSLMFTADFTSGLSDADSRTSISEWAISDGVSSMSSATSDYQVNLFRVWTNSSAIVTSFTFNSVLDPFNTVADPIPLGENYSMVVNYGAQTTYGAVGASTYYCIESAENGICSTGAAASSEIIRGGVSSTVPAPATLALFGLGLAGLGWSRRKKA